ncbi:MAG: M28 family peptidase [Chloroflexi bacterium]|nr:M28 family peptidase [Chloroflexota bacterium]
MTNGGPLQLQLPDPLRLRTHVEALAAHERSNHDRHGEPMGYIDGVFAREGLQVNGHTYTYAGRVGINLLGRKQGAAGQPPLLVCAHYDSVEGSRGADDNASGVAVMLECARLLAPLRLGRAVDFVALDMEETQPEGEGLVGSRAFAREVARERGYAGAFILEMVGYASGQGTQKLPPGFQLLFPGVYQTLAKAGFPGNGLAAVSNKASAELGRALAEAARQGGTPLDVTLLPIPEGAPVPWDLFRSDHASFWSAGIPAILLTDTANYRNPHYHTAGDTPDTLDYDFMARVTAALAGALAGLGQATSA